MKRLLCVGFSVTEERNGYVSVLSKLFDGVVDVSPVSIGGANFELLPFILPKILKGNEGATVLFEISTCYRFKETLQEYTEILEEIDYICSKYDCSPMFVGMYREGVDYKNDLLSLAIEYFSRIKNYQYIDLTTDLLDSTLRNRMLRDGIHTTNEGSNYYGEKIYDVINPIMRSEYQTWSKKDFVQLAGLVENKEVFQFSRGGFETTYLALEAGKEIEVPIPDGYSLRGLVYLMGPKSGDIFVSCSDTDFNRTVHMYDERCYYTRCAYQFFPEQKTRKVFLKQLKEQPIVSLVKGEIDKSARVGSVAGLLVSSNKSMK